MNGLNPSEKNKKQTTTEELSSITLHSQGEYNEMGNTVLTLVMK